MIVCENKLKSIIRSVICMGPSFSGYSFKSHTVIDDTVFLSAAPRQNTTFGLDFIKGGFSA